MPEMLERVRQSYSVCQKDPSPTFRRFFFTLGGKKSEFKRMDYLELIILILFPFNISLRTHECPWHSRKDKLTYAFLIALTESVLLSSERLSPFRDTLTDSLLPLPPLCPHPVESWQIFLFKGEL